MTSAVRLASATLALAAMALVLVAPTAAGSTSCGPRAVSQPFARWLDPAHYFLAPGGDFEGAHGWTLAGGAAIVSGNEPFLVTSATDARSLALPSGSSARSPAFCVDADEPTTRFFVRNTGSVLSTLAVEARVRTTMLGLTTWTTLPLGVVLGTTRTWQPSLPFVLGLSATQLLGGAVAVELRFTPLGAGGAWQVDDVYVDPFKDRAPS